MNSDQRWIEIETKLTFQEHLIESLNQVVVQQQEKIELLQFQIKGVSQRLSSFQTQPETGPADEKPPHY